MIEVGRLRLRSIATPGHTPGSMCFLLEDHPLLFSGDTLFPGGPGQHLVPRAATSPPSSIRSTRLFRLLAGTMVLPGHGLDTTIGTERPHLEEWVDRGW